ncbi:uncharacterized protein LOC113206705 isoform X2 [Frankliniella occidentalis]|nr:uncharacterized protein LOC113206705 isoform X2 [Frankliniella occidentalis]XP_026278705.1 uncharacterized protein LOC113206705 isoform X2 [Frankliniella occidentalis]XP_052127117.1 uncharacterized protein LOC113206705 isoform X2 [Frankliniella occidentalis]XP_052127118.1 uncharacterized protein LOC113206705 isoform X2 [Frankliniella occidentalis]
MSTCEENSMSQTADAASAEDDGLTLTLIDLPDVALLRLLSYLPAKDLVAAGQASPRLGALTREHMPLWRRKEGVFVFDHVEGLVDLLQVVAPVQTLVYNLSQSQEFLAEFSFVEPGGNQQPLVSLKVIAPNVECFKIITKKSGPRLVALEFFFFERGPEEFFAGLQDATALENLTLYWGDPDAGARCTARWPQGVVLDRLVILNLAWGRLLVADPENFGAVTVRLPTLNSDPFQAVRSLIQAHSEKLRHAELSSWYLLPLLKPCIRNLWLLHVHSDEGVSTALQIPELRQMPELKELTINVEAFSPEVESLLKAWPAPSDVRVLELRDCIDLAVVRGLRAGRFKTVISLEITLVGQIESDVDSGRLEEGLQGLPNLAMLRLCAKREQPMPLTKLLSRISVTTIPELLLAFIEDGLVTFNLAPITQHDYAGYKDCRELVRRAPQPLHVVVILRCVRVTMGFGVTQDMVATLFFRHSVAEQCETCGLAETSVCKSIGANIHKRVQVKL